MMNPMRFRSSFGPTRLVALGATLLLVGASVAQVPYAQRSRNITAGVLVVDSNLMSGEPGNFNPFVWLNVEMNPTAKPTGWIFDNPFAPTVVTPEIEARWTALGGSSASGSALTKRHAPYWEVFLTSASPEVLAGYDVLSFSAYDRLSLNASEREKLRQYVDGGGILWVDLIGSTGVDPNRGLPLALGVNTAGSAQRFANPLHPILRRPNAISGAALPALELDSVYGLSPAALALSNKAALSTIETEFARFEEVAADGKGPTLVVGRIGDGFLVVTARGAARLLNQVRTPFGAVLNNVGFAAMEPLTDRLGETAARFAVNLVALASDYPQGGSGSHKVNAISMDLGAPMLRRFVTNGVVFDNPSGGSPATAPVVHNGLVAVSARDTGGAYRLFVYDADPSSDLDGNNNPDDGLVDTTFGANVDLVWCSQALPGPLSSPVFVRANSGQQKLMVVDSAGSVHVFTTLVYDGNYQIVGNDNRPPDTTIAPPGGEAAGFGGTGAPYGPFAPTVHEGLVYLADTLPSGAGRIWVIDASTDTIVAGQWSVGASVSPTLVGAVSASPTVGYIPIPESPDSLDKVLYVPFKHSLSASAGLTSLWLGARSERPLETTIDPAFIEVRTRAAQKQLRIYDPAGPDKLGVRLSLTDQNGEPLDPEDYIDGTVDQVSTGVLRFPLVTALPTGVEVRVDYNIDWSVTTGDRTLRGKVNLPDREASRSRQVLGSVALSREGMIYLTAGNGTEGGGLYALQEIGLGRFQLHYRWELYPAHSLNANGLTFGMQREAILDSDPLRTLLPMSMAAGFTNLTMRGAPAVYNGTVYVTATGTRPMGILSVDSTILLAFQGRPDPPRLLLGHIGGEYSLLQPDFARSANMASPDQFVTRRESQLLYEQNAGIVSMDNMMVSENGTMREALSTSQPVVLRINGQPDQLIHPERNGGRWSPLLWYTIFPGMHTPSDPLVTGDSVFVGGSSLLPDILQGVGPQLQGMLAAVRANISPTDPMSVATPERPWMTQVHLVQGTAGNLSMNENVLWPQGTGVRNFDEFRLRVLQTALGTSNPFTYGISGGDGVLLAWGASALHAFSKVDFLVADQGRLARFDPSGNPIWATDALIRSGLSTDVGNVATLRNLVRPVRAYALGANDYMAVDSDASRIVRFDTSGRELRSIDRFKLDSGGYLPDGFRSGDMLQLNGPRDVLVFSSVRQNPVGLVNPQPWEFWVHYVVADAGHARLVELIDRYAYDPATRRLGEVVIDAEGTRQLGVLRWHTPSQLREKQYGYTGIARLYDVSLNRYVYASGFGGTLPSNVDVGLDSPVGNSLRESTTGNGGLLVFNPENERDVQVINQISLPALPANRYWNYDSGAGAFDFPARPAGRKFIGSVNSVTMRYVQIPGVGPRLAIMFTDPTGVYEIYRPNPAGDPTNWQVSWMLTREAYQAIRGVQTPFVGAPPTPSVSSLGLNLRDLRATFARRLDSGEVIVVNGYSGRLRNGDTTFGEVMVVNGSMDPTDNNAVEGYGPLKVNLGFGSASIRYVLPPIQGARGLINPVFGDKK